LDEDGEDEGNEIDFETNIERDSDGESKDGDIFADTTLENNNENGLEDEEENRDGDENEWAWVAVTCVAAFIIILAAACDMLYSWALQRQINRQDKQVVSEETD